MASASYPCVLRKSSNNDNQRRKGRKNDEDDDDKNADSKRQKNGCQTASNMSQSIT